MKSILFASMFAFALATIPVLAVAEPVPLPCDSTNCGPVPIVLPGCPSCKPGPAPDIN